MQTPRDFQWLTNEADSIGLRLEIVRGLAVSEEQPFYGHQKAVWRIENSIHPIDADAVNPCAWVSVAEVSNRFPDGSHHRADLPIFCCEPDELHTEVSLLSEVVIELLSEDYHGKDLLIGVPFYRQIGVKDGVVFNPRTGDVRHWQQGQPERAYTSPAVLAFQCGCAATV